MAKSTVPKRFKDKHYLNWIKLGQALICVGEGITPFCTKVVDTVHVSLKAKIGSDLCTADCTAKKITRQESEEGKQVWSIECPYNVCNRWLDGITAEMGEQQCSWKHTEVKKWPIQSWQLAKTCMGPGKPPSNHAPAKTDVVGLLQLIINCKAFDDPSLKQQASQVMSCIYRMFTLYHNNN